MYAIIETGGKQYKVKEGEKISIEKVQGNKDETIIFDKVILINDNGKNIVGTPYIPNAKVISRIITQKKGKKIIVFKYKRRKGYRRKRGHRQYITEVIIEKIQYEKA
jgi:large subunit ribosomal protein L21